METKEPIEGAVAIAEYNARYIGPTGGHDTLIDVQETMTDKDGYFRMPPLTTLIYPLAWGTDTSFLLWKPGYKPAEYITLDDRNSMKLEGWFFKGKPGTMVKRRVFIEKGSELRLVRTGIVELERAKTWEERINVKPEPIGEFKDFKKQQNFIRLINEERKLFGLELYETGN